MTQKWHHGGKRRGVNAQAGFILAAALLLAGCGPESDSPEGFPPPGVMRVVASAPRAVESTNLVANPDMRQWWVGSPVPQGYIAPQPGFSTLSPHVVGESGALRQRWKMLDEDRGPEAQFHFNVTGAKRGVEYQLGVLAEGAHGAQAAIALWQQAPGQDPVLLDRNFLTIVGDGLGNRWYARTFSLENDGALIVAVHATAQTKADSWVAWHYWSLKTCQPALPVPVKPTIAEAGGDSPEPGAAASFAGIDFVWCPPGTFTMGASQTVMELSARYGGGEECFTHELPQTEARIEKGFWLSKCEINQEQWNRISNMNPAEKGAEGEGEEPPSPTELGDTLPMSGLSFADAQKFIDALNTLGEGAFRLPKEAEWEYACRAGTSGDFFAEADAASLGEYAWWAGEARVGGPESVQPVCERAPNPWGLHDMLGNVWEWCGDAYQPYGLSEEERAQGFPANTRYHVLRGGGYNSTLQDLRASARRSGAQDARHPALGLRVLREP